MSQDTTTIQITKGQQDTLLELKRGDESFKSVLQRLIENYNDTPEITETRVRELAREEINDKVRLEALE